MGVIPQVVDTVVFIDKGSVENVFDIEFTVKVPAGMTESDLARPVISIRDLESGKPEFEIYTFGEQVVVMPVGAEKRPKASWKAGEGNVKREIAKYARGDIEVEMVGANKAIVKVREKDIPAILGRGGKTIGLIERAAGGVHIDVRPMDESRSIASEEEQGMTMPVSIQEAKKQLLVDVGKQLSGQTVEIMAGGDHIFTATVGRTGIIKIPRGSSLVDRIMQARAHGVNITARLV